MDDYLETFYLQLRDYEFEPDETETRWTGKISIDWKDAKDGQKASSEHLVVISLPEGFPYRPPIVFSVEDPPLTPSWHLNPGDPSSLCLWDPETGWKPEYTAQKLLNRISDWFFYFHADSWPETSQVPDLHLYLDKTGTVIIGEDWKPMPGQFGQFTLWRSRKFAGIFDIACSNRELSDPEPRIADNILIGSNPIQVRGVWFRASQPFVPSKRLDGFLSQVDNLLEQPSGWSKKKSVEAIGIKASGDGFPLTVGYPDHLEEERWLFLWCQFPKDRSKRYKWSSPRNLLKIEVKSFRTAPASKDALLRRSAYISNNLVSKRLVLFGVGAVGSSMALLLAKAGVGELRLVDSDHLMPGNVTRHICGLDYVGLPKTDAVKSIIRRHNPDIYVECYKATWEVNKLRTYGRDCDLVVDATGNTNFSRHLNRVCVELNRPILFAAAYRRASIGRIISRIDKSDPCLECYLANPDAWSSDEYPIIPSDPDESFIEDGCGSVTEEAIALDVEAVANFGTRSIIRLLRGIRNGGNLGFVINEPLLDSDIDLFRHPGTQHLKNGPNPSCTVCGT